MNQEDLLFAKTHEWVAISTEDDQKLVTLGLSAFAVEALTDLVQPAAIMAVLKERIPSGFVDMNQKALDLGIAMGTPHKR